MIRFAFNRLDVRRHDYTDGGHNARCEYRVTHPSNGAIIAYADTQAEAEAVVGLIAGLAQLIKEEQAEQLTTIRNAGGKRA